MDDNEDDDDYLGDFSAAVQEAFPNEDWDDDRIADLKEAIRLCVEEDQGGGEKKKPGTLALIFGGKPKKD